MNDTYKYEALREEIVDLMMQCDEIRMRMRRINDELGLRIKRVSIGDGQTFQIENGIETIAEILGKNDPDAYEDELKGTNVTYFRIFATGEKLFIQEQELSMPVYQKWRE